MGYACSACGALLPEDADGCPFVRCGPWNSDRKLVRAPDSVYTYDDFGQDADSAEDGGVISDGVIDLALLLDEDAPIDAMPPWMAGADTSNPGRKRRTTMSLLDNIRNVLASEARAVTMLLWGPTKSGKTHMISTMPGPVLVLATGYERASDPTLRASGRDDIDIIDIVSVDETPPAAEIEKGRMSMMDVINNLPTIVREKGYKTIAVDTLTTYMKLCINKQRNYGESRMTFNEWDNVGTHFQWLLERLHDTGCHVVWTAHENWTKSDDILVEERADIPGSSLKLLYRTCNIVAKMDARTVIEKDTGINGQEKRKRVKQWVLYFNDPGTYSHPIRVGSHFESRFTKPGILDPSFQKLRELLAPEDGSKPALIKV